MYFNKKKKKKKQIQVFVLTFGVAFISTTTFVPTRLVLELILDNSDKLSGLANGANPNQSSCIKSIFGPLQGKFKLRLFALGN